MAVSKKGERQPIIASPVQPRGAEYDRRLSGLFKEEADPFALLGGEPQAQFASKSRTSLRAIISHNCCLVNPSNIQKTHSPKQIQVDIWIVHAQPHEVMTPSRRSYQPQDERCLEENGGEHDSEYAPLCDGNEMLNSSAGSYVATLVDKILPTYPSTPPGSAPRSVLSNSLEFSYASNADDVFSHKDSERPTGLLADGNESGASKAFISTTFTSKRPSISSTTPSLSPDKSDHDSEILVEHGQELLGSSLSDLVSGYYGPNPSTKVDRPYTSGLGVPDHWENGQTSVLSVISDAGDQQHKRQNRTDGDEVSGPQETSVTQDSVETLHLSESISIPSDKYKLQSEIFNALVPTRNPEVFLPETGFLPKAQLDRLINEESVARELFNYLSYIHTVEQIKSYAKDVCSQSEAMHNGKLKLKSFRKIFALLVLTETSSSISMFLAEDISDLDLPLAVDRKKGTIELGRRDPSGKPGIQPLRCFSHHIWSPTKRRNFEQYQWTMLSPFFSQGKCGDVKHYPLQDQHILPFVASPDAEKDDVEHLGGFGRVFMVRIHEEHRNFHDLEMCQRGFAVKQLYDGNRKAFRKEVSILKRFSGERSHPHIVSLLATYEQFSKYHFIFYRAEGDLFKYWKEIIRQPEFIYDNALWMAKQFAGVADGLLKLHRHLTSPVISHFDAEDEASRKSTNERHVQIVSPPKPGLWRNTRSMSSESEQPNSLNRSQALHGRNSNSQVKQTAAPVGGEIVQIERYGRHGDLNPRNVLWYDDPNRKRNELKGTLKISDFGQAEINSQFSRSKQRSVANTMTYRPPECDLQPHVIRQSYDIWCLGCVYLEFVTWILGGEKLLNIFSRQRRTPDVFLSNKETDTFFQLVRNSETDHTGVMVKPAVTKVGGVFLLLLEF